MNKITYFYIDDCPFCAMADRAIEELTAENPAYAAVLFERIDEEAFPDLAERYDYYYVPTFFFGGEKLFEAYYMIPYEEVKAGVRKAMDAALRQ